MSPVLNLDVEQSKIHALYWKPYDTCEERRNTSLFKGLQCRLNGVFTPVLSTTKVLTPCGLSWPRICVPSLLLLLLNTIKTKVIKIKIIIRKPRMTRDWTRS